MENGTIMAYLKLRPLEPRTKYVSTFPLISSACLIWAQMKDILTGLNYIHVLRLVHADIKEVSCDANLACSDYSFY
jgi:serine/threonine protein kinase